MLHDPARHELLRSLAWDEQRAREAIERIARETWRCVEQRDHWPLHQRDVESGDDPRLPATPLYHGAAGVWWALHYLDAVGAARTPVRVDTVVDAALENNRRWLAASMPGDESASYLMGDTPILLMAQGLRPSDERADRLAALIEGNLDHPARELMWGAPGTMLAALFLHERFGNGDPRWAALLRRSAARLWSQLQWSEEHGCHYWPQELYGHRCSYLDAVHGFVATAFVLIRSRHLLAESDWAAWAQLIETTVARTATREDGRANWRPELITTRGAPKMLMQFCHGAPGFVICLAGMPGHALDALLVEAGEAIWAAGPLAKGSNLCHGTGGNGYAFLKLHERTGDARWLDRARAFAMHGIEQTEADEQRHGQLRYSLWTGDPGFAIYLWDCVRAQSAFPTLDLFFAP